MTDIYFLGGIFLIAVLYSSVGHGGASGYLAFMALVGLTPELMRPSALVLNVFVSLIAFIAFARNRHFRFSLIWPFAVTSIPFAFLGGSFSVDARVYKIILGVFLLFAVTRMLLQTQGKDNFKNVNIPLALGIGAVLGFFSGLIGIGGGIILSPVILLLGWASVKQTAAVSAVFIFVNSIAGLSGFVMHNDWPQVNIGLVVAAGVAGGLLGSTLGSYRIGERPLKYALSFVLLLASVKLFFL